jgi:hypothetical protein
MLTQGKTSKVLIAAPAGAGCTHWREERAARLRKEQSFAAWQVESLHLFTVAALSQPLSFPALKDGVSRGGTDKFYGNN